MDPAGLAVAALATWQAVEVWHHSELFADRRARVEAWGGRPARLLGCPWCLGVWVGAAFAPLAFRPDLPVLSWAGAALAVSRLANLWNDLAHGFTRTPKAGDDLFPETTEGETVAEAREAFDRAACEVGRRAAADVLALCPEVRGVSVTFDYYGDLNDSRTVQKGVWVGRGAAEDGVGPVNTPDGLAGGLGATLNMLDEQLARCQSYLAAFKDDLRRTITELRSRHEELEALKAQAGTTQDAGADAGGV